MLSHLIDKTTQLRDEAQANADRGLRGLIELRKTGNPIPNLIETTAQAIGRRDAYNEMLKILDGLSFINFDD